MPTTSVVLCALFLLFFFGATAFFGKRWLYRWGKRRGKSRFGFYPSSAAAGNALQTMQALAQPRTELMVEEKLKEPAEDDEESGGDDPLGHLHRQAQAIREGQRPERLTARIKDEN